MSHEKSTTRARECLLVPEYFQPVREKIRAGVLTPENCPAYRRLLMEAEESLAVEPFSVVHKRHTPPSGDKRDYWSLSIYFWPNENTPDGLPYVPRDGQVNPEIHDYDRPRFTAMCNSVETLTMAFALSGREEFAAKATELLRTWFVDEATRMNPNMLFAQYIPGDNVELPWPEYPARYVPGAEGRKGVYVSFGGVIEDLNLIPLTDCVTLLRESASWPAADDAVVVQWYREYTEWLLTHQHGLDEAACRNNHGSWYWADIFCFLHFTGQPERAREYAEQVFPERLRLQIEPDGSQPEELGRAISQHYTAFTLSSFVNMALSSGACGYDAWRLETADGRSIMKAMDWFLPYVAGEKVWTWRQIKPFHAGSTVGCLSGMSFGTGESRYRDVVEKFADFAEDDRARLTFGLV